MLAWARRSWHRFCDTAAAHPRTTAAGVAAAACTAYYGYEVVRFAGLVRQGWAGASAGMVATIGRHTPLEAPAITAYAMRSVDDARDALQHGLLQFWPGPALRLANLHDASVLDRHAVELAYACSVLCLRVGRMDDAAALLHQAATIRAAAAASIPAADFKWPSGEAARRAQLEVIRHEERVPRCVSQRALNGFAHLFYATGFDADAIDHFRRSVDFADQLEGHQQAALNARLTAGVAVVLFLSPDVWLPSVLKRLATISWYGVDAVHAPFLARLEKRMELFHLQALARITSRVDLIQALTTMATPMPQDVAACLLDLCRGTDSDGLGPPACTVMNSDWLASVESSLLATSVAGALTELLWCGAIPGSLVARTLEQASQAFAAVESQILHLPGTQQGVFHYHYAKFLCLLPGDDKRTSALKHLDQAVAKHRAAAGSAATHRDLRLLAEAELLRMAMGHPPAQALEASLHLSVTSLPTGSDAPAAEHPVLSRAEKAKLAPESLDVVRRWAAIRGETDWCMSTADARELLKAVETTMKGLSICKRVRGSVM